MPVPGPGHRRLSCIVFKSGSGSLPPGLPAFVTLRQLFLDRKLPVVVAVACMTATSAGCLQNPDMNGAKPEWALLHDSRDGSGALWLGFPHGLEGQVLVRAENVTGFPFSIQVSWIPQAGTPEPMFFGYEMDFPHQEGAASVGVGGTTVDSPPLGEGLDPFAAGANLNVTRPGPGHLVVAWSELPQGIKVWLDGHAEPPTETVLLDAELVRVTGDTDGPHRVARQEGLNVGLGRQRRRGDLETRRP